MSYPCILCLTGGASNIGKRRYFSGTGLTEKLFVGIVCNKISFINLTSREPKRPQIQTSKSFCFTLPKRRNVYLFISLMYRIELLSDCNWAEKCNRTVTRNKTAQAQSSAVYNLGNMNENKSCH